MLPPIPQRPAGPRPEIDCEQPVWVSRRRVEAPEFGGGHQRNRSGSFSSVSSDASVSRLGVYQTNLKDPATLARTPTEAIFVQALRYGKRAGLLAALVQNTQWRKRLLIRNNTVTLDWNQLVIDKDPKRPEPHLLMFLMQHDDEVWEAIITGTLPRLQDEGWNNGYIDRNMLFSAAPGAYLNVTAMRKEVDSTGSLTELSGRLGTLSTVENILDMVEKYVGDDYTDPATIDMRYRIDNAFHDPKNMPPPTPYPRFLTKGSKGVDPGPMQKRQEDGRKWLKTQRVLHNHDLIKIDGIIYRCIQESGMTSGPITYRALEHTTNKATTHLNGIINGAAWVYVDEYKGMRQYAVVQVFDADHPKQQAIAEALLHIVGQTAIEVGGGTNIVDVKRGKKSSKTAPYDIGWDRQFDEDMIQRFNDEIKHCQELGAIADQYVPGELARNAKIIASIEAQLSAAKINNKKLQLKFKQAQEEHDLALAELTSRQTGNPALGAQWLKLKGEMDAILAERARRVANTTTSLHGTVERVTSKVIPQYIPDKEPDADPEADPDADPEPSKYLKLMEGQGDDYVPPAGWSRIPGGPDGMYKFVQDATGKTILMEPRRYERLLENWKGTFRAAMNRPSGRPGPPSPAPRTNRTRAEILAQIKYLQRENSPNKELKTVYTTDERRQEIRAAMAVLQARLDRDNQPPAEPAPRTTPKSSQDQSARDGSDNDDNDDTGDNDKDDGIRPPAASMRSTPVPFTIPPTNLTILHRGSSQPLSSPLIIPFDRSPPSLMATPLSSPRIPSSPLATCSNETFATALQEQVGSADSATTTVTVTAPAEAIGDLERDAELSQESVPNDEIHGPDMRITWMRGQVTALRQHLIDQNLSENQELRAIVEEMDSMALDADNYGAVNVLNTEFWQAADLLDVNSLNSDNI